VSGRLRCYASIRVGLGRRASPITGRLTGLTLRAERAVPHLRAFFIPSAGSGYGLERASKSGKANAFILASVQYRTFSEMSLCPVHLTPSLLYLDYI
jgi:hypothetical protein